MDGTRFACPCRRQHQTPANRFIQIAIALALGVLLGSRFAWAADDPVHFWNVEKLVAQDAASVRLLTSGREVHARLTRSRLAELMEVRRRIELASGVRADLFIVTGAKPNAFASNVATGRNIFAINTAMLDEVVGDPDALAALMGHELAHIERNHIRQRIDAAQNMEAGMNVATIILTIVGVRGAGAIASLGAGALMGGYSRDQEREADSRGLEFAKAAGFNPYGAIRLFEKIQSKHGDQWIPFLASHPTSAERIAALTALAGDNRGHAAVPSTVTELQLESGSAVLAESDVVGEFSATTFDNEARSPTLFTTVLCKLPDGSLANLSRIACIQREGSYDN